MSQSIYKLGPGLAGGPLGFGAEAIPFATLAPDMNSIRFPAGKIVLLSGASAGTEITDGIVEANQKVFISPPRPSKARQYTIGTSYNPELLKYGTVSCVPLLHPKLCTELGIQLSTFRKVNLNELTYVMEFYMFT